MDNNGYVKDGINIKNKISKILSYLLCFVIGLAIVIGVKSCINNISMPKDFKDAKKLLKDEGFQVKYSNKDKDIDSLFDELDMDADGITEVLVAYDEKSDDLFLIIHCDDRSSADEILDDLAWEIAKDDSLYYREYTVKASYKTVYFGHKDLISELTK